MANKPISQQGLPVEFTYQPTQILHGPPKANVIYEQGLGQEGKAPIFPWLQSGLDPIHWTKGGAQSMNDTVHKTMDQLTSMEQIGQTPRTSIRKGPNIQTVNTISETAPGYNRPRPGGYHSVEEAIRAQNRKSYQAAETASLSDLQALGGRERGWTGAGVPPESFLNVMRNHPTTAKQLGRLPEQKSPATIVGGAKLTPRQMRTMPQGLLNVLVKSEAKRLGRMPKPPVAFHPSESSHLSARGQYTTRWRPGLVPIAPGMYVRPEQAAYYQQGHMGFLPRASAFADPRESMPSATFTAPLTPLDPHRGVAPPVVEAAPSPFFEGTPAPDPFEGGPAPRPQFGRPGAPAPLPDLPRGEYVPEEEPLPQYEEEPMPEYREEGPMPQYEEEPPPWIGEDGPISRPDWYQPPQMMPQAEKPGIPKIAWGIGAAVIGGLAIYLVTRKK